MNTGPQGASVTERLDCQTEMLRMPGRLIAQVLEIVDIVEIIEIGTQEHTIHAVVTEALHEMILGIDFLIDADVY